MLSLERKFFTKLVLLNFSVIVIQACDSHQSDENDCNGESTRREIKIATDASASEIDTIPQIASIDSLGSIEVPEINKESGRQEIEKLTFTVTGLVEKVTKYRDGDWKVKLMDENEKYLNCEAPNPNCEYALESPFHSKYISAYSWIESNHENLVGKTVTITGVAFIDIDHHYPRNSADNELELHPILNIGF